MSHPGFANPGSSICSRVEMVDEKSLGVNDSHVQSDFREFEGLRVQVEDVVHMPSLDAPPERPYPFVYFITIHNDSPVPVTIRGRKWVIREVTGEVVVVEGEGVVGQQPCIAPGACFSYNSYHVVAGDAHVRGAFFGEIGNHQRVFVQIPSFELKVPDHA